MASTDPKTLPDLSTWYLVTNLPTPADHMKSELLVSPASLEEIIRLYGLRMWVEQSDKQVNQALGWSQYQVRTDKAIRRHWQLVCCAFSFCWYHASHSSCRTAPATLGLSASPAPTPLDAPVPETGARKKISEESSGRPPVSWPLALRAVRGWLEPWIMLRRYWHGWSQQLPPPALQLLLRQLEQGQPIALYSSA